MTTTIVTSTAELMAALASAGNGDVIALAPGNYGNVSIQNYVSPGVVTITSVYPGNPGRLTGLFVNNSSGLDFSHVAMENTGASNFYPFQVLGSDNINFTNVFVHGALGASPTVDKSSFMVRDSANVSITNSIFSHLENGICHLDSRDLIFSDNRFEDIQNDGIHGGGSSDMTITGNTFTDFSPTPGEHPDAIQFFTRGTSAAASDLFIAGNTVTQGIGAPIQGIFLQDETGVMPFQGVTITGNTIIGGLFNGIAVFDADGVVIGRNDVVAGPDMTDWIRVESSNGVRLVRNTAPYLILSHDTDVTRSHNNFGDIQHDDRGQAAFIQAMACLRRAGGSLIQADALPGDRVTPALAAPALGRGARVA